MIQNNNEFQNTNKNKQKGLVTHIKMTVSTQLLLLLLLLHLIQAKDASYMHFMLYTATVCTLGQFIQIQF